MFVWKTNENEMVGSIQHPERIINQSTPPCDGSERRM